MAVLSTKKILDALAKARAVGQVEESATIAGVHIVLQSLRPEEYEVIHTETQEKDDIAYLNAYRMEHLCRSLMVVGDLDFHDVSGVEVEVEEKDERTGQMVQKIVTIEKHEFVRDYILATWSREAVDTCFRKFNDVVAKAERISSEGVKFEVPDETDEEKYRRILLELREVEQKLPSDLTARLLDDMGLSKKATVADMAVAEERLGKLAAEAAKREAEQPPTAAPQAARRPVYAQPDAVVPTAAPVASQPPQQPPPTPSAAAVVRQRIQQEEQAQGEGGAIRVATPEQLARARNPHQPQGAQPQQAPIASPRVPRSQEIAQAEGFDDASLPPPSIQGGTEIAQVVPQPKLDPKGALSVIDRPASGGINPRFRPPPRV